MRIHVVISSLMTTALAGCLAMTACSGVNHMQSGRRGSPSTALSTPAGPPTSHPTHPTSPRQVCAAFAGGQCPHPEPVRDALWSGLTVSVDGRTLRGRFDCGGRLTADETSEQVTLTYTAPYVRPGARTCALVLLAVHLARPLDHRVLIDAVDGHRLRAAGGQRPAPG